MMVVVMMVMVMVVVVMMVVIMVVVVMVVVSKFHVWSPSVLNGLARRGRNGIRGPQ
jgi:hypothetical protein